MARRELFEANPWPLVLEIMELRAYARTRDMLDRARTPEEADRVEGTPLGKLVREIEFDLAEERCAERKKRSNRQ